MLISMMAIKPWIFIGLMSLGCSFVAAKGPSELSPAVSISLGVSSGPLVSSTDRWRTIPNSAFRPGEDYAFAVRLGLFRAGLAHISVLAVESINERPAYHLLSEAHSTGIVKLVYPVLDRDDTWLDTQSLVTVRYEKKILERHFRIEEAVTLDQVNHRYKDTSYRMDKDRYGFQEGSLPPNILDILGSFFYVRTVPLAVGQLFSIDVYSGGKVWPLEVRVIKRETVKVTAGKFDCFVVEPLLREQGLFISKGKKLEVWLTADDHHMPVRMRAETFVGHVAVELLSYRL
jgi:hypothetical protein